jgi:hypothetical protein
MRWAAGLSLVLMLAACGAEGRDDVAAPSPSGPFACEDSFGLNLDPSGETPGSADGAAALTAMADENGVDASGLTLSFATSPQRVEATWRDSDSGLVVEAVAERFGDRGWYGTQLAGCADFVASARGE